MQSAKEWFVRSSDGKVYGQPPFHSLRNGRAKGALSRRDMYRKIANRGSPLS